MKSENSEMKKFKGKDLVMSAQTDLVDVLAKFTPKLVRMADDGSRED